MKLIHTKSGTEVKPGDTVIDFRGDKAILASFDKRRVYCKRPDSNLTLQWYPSVIGCQVVED